MKLAYLHFELNDQIIQAIGNTILHSIWQGAILAVLVSCLNLFGKKLSSNLRYNILVTLLIIATLVTTLTFTFQLNRSADESEGLIGYIKEIAPIRENSYQADLAHGAVKRPADVLDLMYYYFNLYKRHIVLLWFCIVFARLIQLVVGINAMSYIKKNRIRRVKLYWQDRLQQLGDEMHIRQTISLFESELAKTPMVIGYFKPIILLPLGLINGLSEDNVEAVLLHELAHIRRKDFLINILQTLMEAVFFFNPAILWISSQIKIERENCCDDIAIGKTNNKINYIETLVSCKEYKTPATFLGMTFNRNGTELLNRVKRIAGVPDRSFKRFEHIILSICLLTVLLSTMAFSVKPTINNNKNQPLFISQASPAAFQRENAERVLSNELIADLMQKGLIKNKNNFKIRLTNEALYIDGLKQSKDLHKRVMQLYVKNPNQKLSFTQTVSMN